MRNLVFYQTMKVIYIAGPFRSKTEWGRQQNIREAERYALEVWVRGAAAICPHKNTEHFEGSAPDQLWIQGDLEILRRCDAVLFLPTWRMSQGAILERSYAEERGIPVFDTLDELYAWLTKSET